MLRWIQKVKRQTISRSAGPLKNEPPTDRLKPNELISNGFNQKEQISDLNQKEQISDLNQKEQISDLNQKGPISNGPNSNEPRISDELNENEQAIRRLLGDSSDVVIRRFAVGQDRLYEAMIVAIDGLYEKNLVNEDLIQRVQELKQSPETSELLLEQVKSSALSAADIKEESSLPVIIDMILRGKTALFLEGIAKAMIVESSAWETRKISEPSTEAVIRGPREGFVETLRVNTSMVRRRIHHPEFRLETLYAGEVSKTEIAMAYIKGIANPDIVDEVRTRIQKIKTDNISESGILQEFIEDAPYSFFPTIGNSEKPDVVAAKLMEGRVALIVEGTPIVLTLPYLFVEGFQNAEDYYSRPYYASIIRLIRYFAYLITTMLPGLYIASVNFHKEMIPTALLVSIAEAREAVPFPLHFEVFAMVVMFELLREAGTRMPRPVGQAVSIVGALVIGEAAVTAGLVGAPTIIVVAAAGFTSFVVTAHADSAAIIRYLLLILSSIVGLLGLIMSVLVIIAHMISLRSVGLPYLSPLAPMNTLGLRDTLLRFPMWALSIRPQVMRTGSPVRQGPSQRPRPPKPYRKPTKKDD